MGDWGKDTVALPTVVTRAPVDPEAPTRRTECIVEIYGNHLGRKIDLHGDQWIGRQQQDCEIVVPDDSVSRRHARFRTGEDGVVVIDENSTNGTFVNDTRVDERRLRHGDLLKIGSTIFKFLGRGSVERDYHEEIYRMTIVDGLTGVYNRRYLQEFAEREVARSRRHHRPLTMVFDLDHFKRINDDFGHLIGDRVLREFARIVDRCVRREEVFGRYGGEEFCALLPETDLQGAAVFAERIRRLTEQREFSIGGAAIPVTVSAGVAALDENMTGWDDLIATADRNLYRAKRDGRNRIVASR